ncbi:cytochrome c oxidase assembly factor Coa1 family protein [uncultured Psychroserpens sp.]|uniref:RDD family protein n=1 Tax=uncultured Psychroserpens sp. TaxID=255436 RepID=UPI00263049A6|nr:cytochrome c oxidase assembly factor Coa1 family protein [uncultured Psychroserpens sp.]
MDQTFENKLLISSRKRRIVAFLIDHTSILFLIVTISFLSLGTSYIDENNPSNLLSLVPTILFGFLLYFLKDSIKGVSLGKWIMGIMVRDINNYNEVPSLGRLFIRNLLIIIWPIELFGLLTNQEKRRFGDKIAKTTVLKSSKKLKVLPRVFALAGVGITYFMFIFIFVFTSMKSSDAYKAAIVQIEKNQNIIDEVGGIKEYELFPNGSISMHDGFGEANFEIKVIGNDKDMNVNIYLTKFPNEEWKLLAID